MNQVLTITIHYRSAIICTIVQYVFLAIIRFDGIIETKFVTFFIFPRNFFFDYSVQKLIKKLFGCKFISICDMTQPSFSNYFHCLFGKNRCGFHRTGLKRDQPFGNCSSKNYTWNSIIGLVIFPKFCVKDETFIRKYQPMQNSATPVSHRDSDSGCSSSSSTSSSNSNNHKNVQANSFSTNK